MKRRRSKSVMRAEGISVSVPVKREHTSKNFLNSVCPFMILEDRVTWGEFIATYIKGMFGVVAFYAFYIFMVATAECVGVID